LGVTTISGVRESPILKKRPIEGPEKISPMPAMLFDTGDAASRSHQAGK